MNRKQLIFVLLLVSASIYNPYLYAQTEEDIRERVIVGCRLLNSEEVDKAIAEFDAAISMMKTRKPEYYMAYYNRARAYERKGQIDNALSDYSEAIALDPRYLLAYYGRAYLLQKKGQFNDAIFDYTRILEIDKNQPHAYNNRGLCYYQKNELSSAMSDYNNAIELDCNLLNAYYNRAELKVHNRQYYAAALDFQKELQIHPNLLKAKYYERAVSAFYNKRYLDSWKAVKKLLTFKADINANFLEDLKKASGMANPPEEEGVYKN